MMKSFKVSLNVKTFKKIITQFGMNFEELEKNYKIKIDQKKVEFETTIAKLRKLGEFLYIPINIFFLEKVPEFKKPNDYRGLTKIKLTKNTINAIRMSYWVQDLYTTFTQNRQMEFLQASIDEKPEEVGLAFAKQIQIEKLRKSSQEDALIFLRKIREFLETKHILVIQEKFHSNETRGFSLSGFPSIITLNATEQPVSRIFTLFHEIGHIILNEPGISDPAKVDPTIKNENAIENWCNSFASACLIPPEIIRNASIDEANIGNSVQLIADELLISKLSVAYKLLLLRRIDRTQFNDYKGRYKEVKQSNSFQEFNVPRRNMVVSQKGKLFTRVILNAWRENKINQIEASEILNVKDKTFQDLINYY